MTYIITHNYSYLFRSFNKAPDWKHSCTMECVQLSVLELGPCFWALLWSKLQLLQSHCLRSFKCRKEKEKGGKPWKNSNRGKSNKHRMKLIAQIETKNEKTQVASCTKILPGGGSCRSPSSHSKNPGWHGLSSWKIEILCWKCKWPWNSTFLSFFCTKKWAQRSCRSLKAWSTKFYWVGTVVYSFLVSASV